jgi:hypothetical protein
MFANAAYADVTLDTYLYGTETQRDKSSSAILEKITVNTNGKQLVAEKGQLISELLVQTILKQFSVVKGYTTFQAGELRAFLILYSHERFSLNFLYPGQKQCLNIDPKFNLSNSLVLDLDVLRLNDIYTRPLKSLRFVLNNLDNQLLQQSFTLPVVTVPASTVIDLPENCIGLVVVASSPVSIIATMPSLSVYDLGLNTMFVVTYNVKSLLISNTLNQEPVEIEYIVI